MKGGEIVGTLNRRGIKGGGGYQRGGAQERVLVSEHPGSHSQVP